VKVRTGFWWGNPREREHLQDPCVDGRIILRWIFRKWDGGMDWIDLAQDRDRWRAIVNAVMNLWVPQNAGDFLTNWEPVSFSRWTVLHGVSKYLHSTELRWTVHLSLYRLRPPCHSQYSACIKEPSFLCPLYDHNVTHSFFMTVCTTFLKMNCVACQIM